MTLICNHEWTSRSGYDSGSRCSKCGKITNREIDTKKSEELGKNVLKENSLIASIKADYFPELFCEHSWRGRSGYDSGSVCSKCGKLTDNDLHSPKRKSKP